MLNPLHRLAAAQAACCPHCALPYTCLGPADVPEHPASSMSPLHGRAMHSILAASPGKPLNTACPQVMELMQQSGLSSAALVDSEGRIVGNFSVSDLR